jgi:hypothetical protein
MRNTRSIHSFSTSNKISHLKNLLDRLSARYRGLLLETHAIFNCKIIERKKIFSKHAIKK